MILQLIDDVNKALDAECYYSALSLALTFPDIFTSTGNPLTAFCGTLTALWLAYRKKSLVVVALGAILTVIVTGLWL